MGEKKKSSDNKQEQTDETIRNNKQKKMRKEKKIRSQFEDALDELLDDPEMYDILKKLQD